MASGTGTVSPCRLNKVFSLKFKENHLIWEAPEKDLMVQQPECCDYNNNTLSK